jgi:sulfite exporter TauE/SafE
MTALLTAVFVASLVGSLHCAGMCGGIVTLCVSGRPVTTRRAWRPHVLYNLGRLVSYATLGAVAGGLGAAIDLGGSAVGWSRVATLVAGGTMIVIGGVALLRSAGVRIGGGAVPAPIRDLFARGLAVVRTWPAGVQPLLIGLLTGLLPCGWLYAFVVAAAGTGHPWLGAATMAVFWAGTVPVMLGLGIGAQTLAGPLRRHVPRVTAVALVVVAVITITGRLRVPAYADAPAVSSHAHAVDHVRSLDGSSLPCCDDEH